VALDRAWDRGERAVARPSQRRPAGRRPPPPSPRTKDEPAATPGREPEIVRTFRGEFAKWAAVSGALLLINIGTGITEPWFLLVAGIWGFGLGNRYARLWQAGYSWRDVINRPPAPDAVEARMPSPARALRTPAEVGTNEEFGAQGAQIKQMLRDRDAVRQIVEKLPASERALLPDVVKTVDGLGQRAVDLARTLSQMQDEVDPDAVARLDARVETLRTEGKDDRRLELLERQREALTELVTRRRSLEAQFESCVLAVQNVRFDLLRLRSAGVSAVLDDLTSATQAARALGDDVEAAIDAAGEIRRELGK
jgi:hypothetical protein